MPDTKSLAPYLSLPAEAGGDRTIQRALEAVRSHLGMDVAYLSEFVGNDSVFRAVDSPGFDTLPKAGDKISLDDVYCQHILAGRLPQLMPDTSQVPFAATVPITEALGIGAHLSVPVELSNGEVYGMFCCLSFSPDNSLNPRDLQMMKLFASLAAVEIDKERAASQAREAIRARIRDVVGTDRLQIVYQPICRVDTGEIVGLEALSRFDAEPRRSPDLWFAEAAEAGLGTWLEMAAIQRSTGLLAALPPSVYLAVNASPQTVLSGEFETALSGAPLSQIVLELTEHASVDDYPKLIEQLEPLRAGGLRLAVDDAGSGYSGLQHILALRPDLLKLDMALIRDINTDTARQALAAALATFARNTGAVVIAEGVETEAELRKLRELGLGMVQGYLLGRPMAADGVLAALALPERQRVA